MRTTTHLMIERVAARLKSFAGSIPTASTPHPNLALVSESHDDSVESLLPFRRSGGARQSPARRRMWQDKIRSPFGRRVGPVGLLPPSPQGPAAYSAAFFLPTKTPVIAPLLGSAGRSPTPQHSSS